MGMASKVFLLRNFVRRAPKRERLPTSRYTCCFEKDKTLAPVLKPIVSAAKLEDNTSAVALIKKSQNH